MKKILLISSMILSLGAMTFPSYAAKFQLGGVKEKNGIRYSYSDGNASFVYCHYEYYNLQTGKSAGSAGSKMYIRLNFKGCPGSL